MPASNDQITNLDAELDALSSPTTAQTYVVSKDYDPDVVAASAARRALAGGGGGGAAFPDEWTVGDDGALTVADPVESGGVVYFSLTPADRETFSRVLRVFNSLTLDDSDLIAKNDNDEIYVRLVSTGDGFLRAYKPDNSVFFQLDGSTGTVTINGAPYAGFPVSLEVGENVRFVSADDPTTVVTVANSAGHLVINGDDAGVSGFELSTTGGMTLAGANVFSITPPVPEIPATPTAQDIADVLVALGLATQAA